MREGLLTPDDLEQLFADLAGCTTVLAVQEKGRGQDHAHASPSSLDAARQRLLNGSVHALQIRYRYDGHEWTDTLMRLPSGVRLVRCQHPRMLDPN
jgi:hypothetical protein